MGSKIHKEGGGGLSRRDFLKVSAVGAGFAAGGALDWAVVGPAFANTDIGMVEGVDYTTYHTTCPYCSASCGQIVAVSTGTSGHAVGDVLDIWGDARSPISQGGLCAKGAGALQHVNNTRRLGAFAGAHPVNSVFAADTTTYTDGVAYKRTGNGDWSPMTLTSAMGEIATKLVSARDAVKNVSTNNSKGVAFLGCSHMNNEQNYTYRKLIAQFGSSNTEHQARI